MKTNFELVTKYAPSGDQKYAIPKLCENFKNGIKKQVLLGATGTGKTFTFANVINNLQKKALVLVHNKTLAAQIYLELKEFFPKNKVEYFVSYFDYYQPEAYIPHSDMYVEKSSQANAEIEMLRLSTITSLVCEDDVIVVASVASIYPSVSRDDFELYMNSIKVGQTISIKELRQSLVQLNYERNDIELSPGKFRTKGDVMDIVPGYSNDYYIRISFFGNEIETIDKIDILTNKKIESLKQFNLTTANEYIVNRGNLELALEKINSDLDERIKYFIKENKLIEAQRIEQRTKFDMEAIVEFGYCSGIENYARYLENRESGSTPYTIFDYFKNQNSNDWLLIIDESHITLPQVRGMYNTDRSRKETLVNYGFRLPSALDNRPLQFDEFLSKMDKVLFVSATPNDYEKEISNDNIVEQIVRPTGLLDPTIDVRPTKNQLEDILIELQKQIKNNEKTFITVMTINMAEELTHFLQQRGIKAAYLHNELKTLERSKIINNLRKGVFDVLIGINLLREGLDVPEVSLVIILDADKPGFFRSDKSLIQIIGRAARNSNGHVIMYGDEITLAMKYAIDETTRRREIQMEYNRMNNIIPKTISKPISEDISPMKSELYEKVLSKNKTKSKNLTDQKEIENLINEIRDKMLEVADNRDYELAAEYRDILFSLESKLKGEK